MAFSTLDAIRTGVLNDELGLTADNDDSWGTTAQRNNYLRRAFAKLWPIMGRARRHSLTLVNEQRSYDLTALAKELRIVSRVELLDSSGFLAGEPPFEVFTDEAAEPATVRLEFAHPQDSSLTCYLYGYRPYVVPANGAASCDLPPELEYVVSAGARVEAYRAKLNQYANFPRLANENRANALSASEVLELMRTAVVDFREAREANRMELAAIRRAARVR